MNPLWTFVGGLLVALAYALLTGEVKAWLRRFSRFIVRKSVERLPPKARERYEQEWHADLDILEQDGRELAEVSRAIGYWLSSTEPTIALDELDDRELWALLERTTMISKRIMTIHMCLIGLAKLTVGVAFLVIAWGFDNRIELIGLMALSTVAICYASAFLIVFLMAKRWLNSAPAFEILVARVEARKLKS